jgi:hypothetical protein
MKRCVTIAFLALIEVSLCPVFATAQDQSQTQAHIVTPPSGLADAYRGMIVCEKAPGAADILRVPLDLAVRGNEIQFARPLFNPRGTGSWGTSSAQVLWTPAARCKWRRHGRSAALSAVATTAARSQQEAGRCRAHSRGRDRKTKRAPEAVTLPSCPRRILKQRQSNRKRDAMPALSHKQSPQCNRHVRSTPGEADIAHRD